MPIDGGGKFKGKKNAISDVVTFEKTILIMTNKGMKKVPYTESQNLSKDFMNKVARANRSKIYKHGGIFNLHNRSIGKEFRNKSPSPKITRSMKDIRRENIPTMDKKNARNAIRARYAIPI